MKTMLVTDMTFVYWELNYTPHYQYGCNCSFFSRPDRCSYLFDSLLSSGLDEVEPKTSSRPEGKASSRAVGMLPLPKCICQIAALWIPAGAA